MKALDPPVINDGFVNHVRTSTYQLKVQKKGIFCMMKRNKRCNLHRRPPSAVPLVLELASRYVPAIMSMIRPANCDMSAIGSTPESINSLDLFTVSAVSADMANSNRSSNFSSDTTPT